MNGQSLLRKWWVFGWAALLVACGGGSEWAGIDGSGEKPDLLVSGPINGFGSVIVNGVRYNTDQAQVYIRGQRAQETDLRVGDVVTVLAGVDEQGQPLAYEVRYQPTVTGDIQWVDAEQGLFSVLGQTIGLQEDTLYGLDILPHNIDGLRVGLRVSVSGVADQDGVVRASRVEADSGSPLELSGTVRAWNGRAREFWIREQQVRYSALMAATWVEGQSVVVRGQVDAEGILQADAVEAGPDYRQLQGVRSVELSGLVRNLGDSDFHLDTVPVRVTSKTQYLGGNPEDLSNNLRVRVVGSMGPDHRLTASQLVYLSAPDTQVFGLIEYLAPDLSGGPLLGRVWLQNAVFDVRRETRLSGDQDTRINFHDLRVGDWVYVSGYQQDKRRIASSLAVDSRAVQSRVVEIQGWLHQLSLDDKAFSLYETRIETDEDTVYRWGFRHLSEQDFYAGIREPSLVKVRGLLQGNRLVANRVERLDPWGGGYPPPPPPPPPPSER